MSSLAFIPVYRRAALLPFNRTGRNLIDLELHEQAPQISSPYSTNGGKSLKPLGLPVQKDNRAHLQRDAMIDLDAHTFVTPQAWIRR